MTPISPTRSVREFLMRENPEAARVIAERLETARRKGLWHPRRNDLGEGLSRHPSGGGAMSKAFARGACPGLSAPMQTGDGLLARLVPAGPIPLDAFIGLCEAARAHGNGIMEISARGSIQIRGLSSVSAPLFAEAVETLGIDLCESVPVLSDPLPDDPSRSDRFSGDRRGASTSHRRRRSCARAESLRGD